MNRCVRVLVKGRVQGVGYRMWCVSRASGYGLEGWVRNLSGDAVEAVLSGDAAMIDEMLHACWIGPPMAAVMTVAITEADPDLLDLRGGQGGFVVLSNA